MKSHVEWNWKLFLFWVFIDIDDIVDNDQSDVVSLFFGNEWLDLKTVFFLRIIDENINQSKSLLNLIILVFFFISVELWEKFFEETTYIF